MNRIVGGSMSNSNIIVYGTLWCGDCKRARRILDENEIMYEWVNIDKDKDAEAYVLKVNDGHRSVPTILFTDGSILVEPSNLVLKEKIQTIYD
jgi:mycoredoxin